MLNIFLTIVVKYFNMMMPVSGNKSDCSQRDRNLKPETLKSMNN